MEIMKIIYKSIGRIHYRNSCFYLKSATRYWGELTDVLHLNLWDFNNPFFQTTNKSEPFSTRFTSNVQGSEISSRAETNESIINLTTD